MKACSTGKYGFPRPRSEWCWLLRRKKKKELLSVFDAEDVEAVTIGRFTGDGKITLRFHGVTVGEMDCEFLHEGVPRLTRKAEWSKKTNPEPDFPCPDNLGAPLKKILSAWNVCSKEWIIRPVRP